jgi:signal peptidase II
VVLGAGFDIAAKSWAFGVVPEHSSTPIEVVPGFFYIQHAENPGAMWSLLQDLGRWVWVVIRGGVALALSLLWLRQHPRVWWANAGFILVLSGALGNLYDNLFWTEGRVRDFLALIFWNWRFPVFNVADSMICVGAPLLLLYFYRDGTAREAGASNSNPGIST